MSPYEPCCSIMLGSGTDTYDPTCQLPKGHSGPCKSTSAIDQHRLSKDELRRIRRAGAAYPTKAYYVEEARKGVTTWLVYAKNGQQAREEFWRLGEAIDSDDTPAGIRSVRRAPEEDRP